MGFGHEFNNVFVGARRTAQVLASSVQFAILRTGLGGTDSIFSRRAERVLPPKN
jgi:hypothetical protein